MYQEFLNYKNETGNSNVPLHHPILGKWVRTQRTHYKQQQQQQQQRLVEAVEVEEELTSSGAAGAASGYSSDDSFKQEEHRYNLLQSEGFILDNVRDHEWMHNFHQLARAFATNDNDGKDHTNEILKEDEEGGHDDHTDKDAEQLSIQHRRRRRPPLDKTLNLWVKTQRRHYKQGTLSKEQIGRAHV